MFKRNTSDKEVEKVYDITEVLDVFGRYQVTQYMLICVSILFVSMVDINYVFVANDLNYRCVVPECDGINTTATQPLWWPMWATDRCTKPVLKADVQRGSCTNASFLRSVDDCTEWVYENNNTIVAEFNLACQPWRSNLVGSVHNIGLLLATIVFGFISDRYGRKWILILCSSGACLGYLKTFTTSWHAYIFVEFLESCMSGGTYIPALVLMLEICSINKRILSGILFSSIINISECTYAFIAKSFPYWKNIISVINIPCSLFISFIFLIGESPRWQIVHGRIDEAKINLQKIAKSNKIKIKVDDWEKITVEEMKDKFNIKETKVVDSFKTIFTSREIVKRLFVTSVCRFSSSMMYYGVIMNSVWLPGDKYMNFFMSGLMSFPGDFLYVYAMNKIGRKVPLQAGFLLSAVFSIATGFVSDSYKWTKISLFLVNKMIISGCATGSITYTMELFPTSARGCCNGCVAFSSGFGLLLAPLTPILNTISTFAPGICFSAFATLSGLLLMLTPETKDQPLMDTVQQVEDSVIKKRKTMPGLTGEDNLGFCEDCYVTKL